MSNNQQSQGIRGLSIFIGDIRACQTKEQEIKVVHKEMAKIRQKFQNKGLSGYDKKKYVWKLIYAHILGYEVESGHEEALNLINAQKFTEKSSGYIAIGIMLNEKSNYALFERVLNAVKADLNCGNEVCEGLALATLGNIGFSEVVPELAPIVIEKSFSPNTNSYVRKRAIICLLSFFRRNRTIFEIKTWSAGFKLLLQQKHKGILMSTCSLMQGVINIMGRDGLYDLIPLCIKALQEIESNAEDYYYYKTSCPWLQVKILKILQMFPPPENKVQLQSINDIMMKIMTKTEVTKNVNKNNSDHSILFEVFNLIIHYGESSYEVLREDTIKLLGQYIDVKEPNIRYLALETMSRMSQIDRKSKLIKKYVKVFFKNLRDNDISIRKIALNSLFSLCDAQMSGEVVNEILDYLQEKDFELKEEIVLKVAILAEKFAENLNWYIDVIIKLIEYAGDYVNEDLWFRVAQIITGFGNSEPNNQLQRYAALKMFDVMKTKSLHESMIKIGAYVLCEFGYLIAEQDGKSIQEQFDILDGHFYNVSNQTKAMLLTSYMKMLKICPAINQRVCTLLAQYEDHWDEELQQRACEYLKMLEKSKQSQSIQQLCMNALDRMPNFSEELQTNNVLTRRILELKVKKGFAINKEEAEKNMKNDMKKYATNVSKALTSNQINSDKLDGIDIDGSMSIRQNQFKTVQSNQQQFQTTKIVQPKVEEGNLLDLLDMPSQDVQQVSNVQSLDTMAELAEILGSSNYSAQNQPAQNQNFLQDNIFENVIQSSGSSLHEFQQSFPNDFSQKQTVQFNENNSLSSNCSNLSEWKKLLPNIQTQGTLYQDDYLLVNCNIQQFKYLQRLLLTFQGSTGEQPQNIEINLINNESDKLIAQCSPIRYSQDGSSPQAIIMAMMDIPFSTPPQLQIKCSFNQHVLNTTIRLPIYINRFIDLVDMPQEAFIKNWTNITLNQPDSFQKIDMILRNPAPSNVPHEKVLQQMETFLSSALNLKVYSNDTIIQAVGQVITKPISQNGFPQNPNQMEPPENVPLMIEAQFYPQIQTQEFRLSLRAANNKIIAQPIINFIKFYMNV